MSFFIRQVISFFISIVLVLTSFLGLPSPKTEKVDKFRVTTYVVGEYVQSESSIYPEDFDYITDVILFGCATFNSEGEVICNTPVLETALTNLKNAIGNREIHITLNLLGPGAETDSTVWEEQMEAQSIEHNKAFTSGILEDNIIAVLDKYGFDGVHFDYEYPLSQKAWRHYNNFIVSLDEKLGDKYSIGIAVSDWNIKLTHAAAKAIDTFELMLYDMVDGEGKHSTYEDSVKAAQKVGIFGLPLEKVNAGLPFYSRPTDLSAYWYDYKGYCEKITNDGWYHCNNTNKDFWFNTPDVIQAKTDYAINHGFGGVMIWHYSCDIPSSRESSLLRAIGSAINENY